VKDLLKGRKPSPALIVAIVALSAALVGTAVAGPIAGISLSKKEKKQTSKIARKQANKVFNKRRGQLVGPQGPKGENGAVGSRGPTGPSGATNVVMRKGPSFSISRNSFAVGNATCNPGERATGGGVLTENVYYPTVVSSFPLPQPNEASPNNGVTPTGWRVWMANKDVGSDEAPASTSATPYVICASP
jgi:hypothetical protein